MAHNREKPPKHQQKQPQRAQGKRPQGVNKAKWRGPLRRSPRLNPEFSEHTHQKFPPTARNTSWKRNLSNTLQPRSRKRPREADDLPLDITAPHPKRPRASPAAYTATRRADRETSSSSIEAPIDPVNYWRENQSWPREYFEPDNTMNRVRNVLTKKSTKPKKSTKSTKSTPSLGQKRTNSGSLAASSVTPSDQISAPYSDARYRTLLETKGSYLRKHIRNKEKGITTDSKRICQTLLETDQNVPKDSLFDDDIFPHTCDMIDDRNEAKVALDISRLLVPSAQALAARNAELECLIESANEGWNNSIPLTGTRPQPDYSVGFNREAFSDDQLRKLSPFIGKYLRGDQSYFMATYYMYFPFLTCEIKCGAAALEIADRQNAHSMTLAVRGIVELFRLVKREDEINREILAFSVSHDNQSVRIYGHYAVIDGSNVTFHRHLIHDFNFTTLDGKEKWTAYKFTKNVYEVWMPTHFKRLCSAIDDLPHELDPGVPQLPQDSVISKDLESHNLSRSLPSQTGDGDSQLGTPNTSFTEQEAPRRSRRKVAK